MPARYTKTQSAGWAGRVFVVGGAGRSGLVGHADARHALGTDADLQTLAGKGLERREVEAEGLLHHALAVVAAVLVAELEMDLRRHGFHHAAIPVELEGVGLAATAVAEVQHEAIGFDAAGEAGQGIGGGGLPFLQGLAGGGVSDRGRGGGAGLIRDAGTAAGALAEEGEAEQAAEEEVFQRVIGAMIISGWTISGSP